jgi:hypothetical protein
MHLMQAALPRSYSTSSSLLRKRLSCKHSPPRVNDISAQVWLAGCACSVTPPTQVDFGSLSAGELRHEGEVKNQRTMTLDVLVTSRGISPRTIPILMDGSPSHSSEHTVRPSQQARFAAGIGTTAPAAPSSPADVCMRTAVFVRGTKWADSMSLEGVRTEQGFPSTPLLSLDYSFQVS